MEKEVQGQSVVKGQAEGLSHGLDKAVEPVILKAACSVLLSPASSATHCSHLVIDLEPWATEV